VLIYACTANTFKEDMDKALASGMNDFLTKPINIQTLLQKMAQTIHPGFQNRAGN
jgi:CheY-like chemotaxis protein